MARGNGERQRSVTRVRARVAARAGAQAGTRVENARTRGSSLMLERGRPLQGWSERVRNAISGTCVPLQGPSVVLCARYVLRTPLGCLDGHWGVSSAL